MNAKDLRMSRNPLPDDFDANAIGQGDMIVSLHHQLDIPLRDLIELTPQALYDLARRSAAPEDREDFERVVIIDDETGKRLKRNMRQMLRRARPSKQDVPHDIGVTSRAIALSHLSGIPSDASLTKLEKELVAAGSEPQIVIEDGDYDDYGKEMNRIISQRPHGRSRSLDHAPDIESNGLNKEIAQAYVVALNLLINDPEWATEGLANSRRVTFTYAPENNDKGFEWSAQNQGMDIVVLSFAPGNEEAGPTNIAVYEERDGKLTVWPECSVWGLAERSAYFIASNDGQAGFLVRQGTILLVWGIPADDLTERFKEGEAKLKAVRQCIST